MIPGCFAFVDTILNETVGIGSRVKYDGRTLMLMASHTVRAIAGREVAMSTMEKQVRFDMSWPLAVWSSSQDFDYVLVEVPESVWAAIGVKALGLAMTPLKTRCQTYGLIDGMWHTSFSPLSIVKDDFGLLRHSMTTYLGWSGAPIVANGHVVGIHTGSLAVGVNKGFSLNAILGTLESDAPAYAWREHTPAELDELLLWDQGEENRRVSRKSKKVFTRDYEMEVIIGSSGTFARKVSEVQPEVWNVNPSCMDWADEMEEDEWDSRYESVGPFKPVFRQGSVAPAQPSSSGTSRGMNLKPVNVTTGESGSSRVEPVTSSKPAVKFQTPPLQKHTPNSQNSQVTSGPVQEQRKKEPRSSSIPPSSRKAESRPKKRSKKSRAKSLTDIRTPGPRLVSTTRLPDESNGLRLQTFSLCPTNGW